MNNTFLPIKKKKIYYIIITLVIVLSLPTYFILKVRYYDLNLLFSDYTPQDQIVTRDKLLRDIDIIKAREGINAIVDIIANKDNSKYLPEEVFWESNGKPKEGNVISMAVRNRIFVDSKKPVEIRFFIRIMLYLQERKLDSNMGNIIGLTGGFTRSEFEKFNGEGNQPFKMSIEEFNNLYKEANVSSLDTEKQIDILTDLWIKKTGYWRRGLNGVEEKPEQ